MCFRVFVFWFSNKVRQFEDEETRLTDIKTPFLGPGVAAASERAAILDRNQELFRPLAKRAEDWQAIPGVSKWVMAMIDEVILSNLLEDHRASVVFSPPKCAARILLVLIYW